MKIEAITICTDYSDFLAYSLPLNKAIFDRLVVVTTPSDRKTRDLCEFHHVECIQTDVFYANGASFNKGAAINEALKVLSKDGWIIHFDADIVLPPRTRDLLEKIDLDPSCIYGIDRIMCRSFEQWSAFLQHPEVQHSCDIFVQANAFPLGVRVAKLKGDGYVPIGFFQMWNPSISSVSVYKEHQAADRGDMAFALQWPRRKRLMIPEIVGIHLESEQGKMGTNWNGRSTKPFGIWPTLDEIDMGVAMNVAAIDHCITSNWFGKDEPIKDVNRGWRLYWRHPKKLFSLIHA